MTTHRVFVYGTLKEGYANHGRILSGRARKLGTALTASCYHTMFCTGAFPVLFRTHWREEFDRGQVRGEVYEVDDTVLAQLDLLESNGRMYQRRVINVIVDTPERTYMTTAWAYYGMSRAWRRFKPDMPKVLPSPQRIIDWTRGWRV